jgi:hypothetical protein
MSAPAKARRGGRKARSAARGAGRSGRKAARSDWAEAAGRIGFTAKGLLYVLVGLIAFGVAIGERGGTEGQRGALAGLSGGALGKALLIALAIGLGGYAIWRLVLAILGPPRKEGATDKAERVGSVVLAIVYASLCAYAVGIVIGAGKANGASTGPDEATRALLDKPLGVALVIAMGLVLAGIGVHQAHKAATRGFLEDLKTSAMSARERRIAVWLGVSGHAALAVVSGLGAAFVIKAAIEHDPSEAVGLDGALQRLVAAPAGPLLLGLVAVGLILFGLYLLVEARHRKI